MSRVTLLLVCLISGKDDLSSSLDWEVGITNSATGADFWALGVKRNGNLASWLLLLSLTSVVNDRLVIWVVTMRAVHANNVEASLAELVDLNWRVGFWADGTDDGSYLKLVQRFHYQMLGTENLLLL